MDHSKIATRIFNKYAAEYMNKFMNVDLYKDSLNFFCDTIKKQGPSVLELACGPGNITSYLLNKRKDLLIFGIDLAPNMIELAKQNNPSADFKVMDCREISSLNNKYDAIVCGFCLPYLNKSETKRLFSGCSVLLSPGGIFYISTMEDDYSNSGFRKGSQGDEIYMHYYREKDLADYLIQNDFRIIYVQRLNSVMGNGDPVTDLIIIAQKN